MNCEQAVSSATESSTRGRPLERTGEPASHRADGSTDALLEDLRLLGRLLGDVIREQAGSETYALVERIRFLAVASRRKADSAAAVQLRAVLDSLTADQAVTVIRAFTYLIHLANLAEDRSAVRLCSAQQRYGRHPEGSIRKTLAGLTDSGVSSAEIARTLLSGYVSPVLTAHPTEVQRRSVLDAQRSISALLVERDVAQSAAQRFEHGDDDLLLGQELAENNERIRARLAQLWHTRLIRFSKLTVEDEIENSLSCYESTFLREIPRIRQSLERQLERNDIGPFLRMGSWIGGDRDGNPNVSAETLRYALRRQSEVAIRHYLEEIRQLRAELSFSTRLVDCSPELEQLAAASPDHSAHRLDEPYRRALSGVHARLSETLQALSSAGARAAGSTPPLRYACAGELSADLRTIERSLLANQGDVVTRHRLRPLIFAVEAFGFQLATVDLRQNADKHEAVVAELLQVARLSADYAALGEPERRALLVSLLDDPRPLRLVEHRYTRFTQDELAIFEAARDIRAVYGRNAIRHCIISHTEAVSDLLEVLLLQKEAGLMVGTLNEQAICGLVVVPLFETIDDLRNAPAIMREYFCIPGIAALIERSGAEQDLMLGYSDSNKDGGIFSSSWALYRTGQQLTDLFAELAIHGLDPGRSHDAVKPTAIRLRMFHGRGGTVGRGGGPSYQAILAQPPGSVQGQLRLTEQGEVVGAKYSNPRIGRANLEALVSAALEATLGASVTIPSERWAAISETLAADSMSVYRRLVYDTPGFQDYFFDATPIREISELHIGSRPSSRSRHRNIEDLRAVPWSFSWGQCRVGLPGWYGFGSAVDCFLAGNPGELGSPDTAQGPLAALQAMYQDWPFFRNLVSNIRRALRQCDLVIAEKYASLVVDAQNRTTIFEAISSEWQRTVEAIATITGTDIGRLTEGPSAAAEIRSPFIDPLHHLQVELMRRYRAGQDDEKTKLGLHISINGISAGLRSTG